MNANAIAALAQQSFPPGTVPGRLCFKLKQGVLVRGTQYATPPAGATAASVTFPSVAAGTGYTVEAQTLNSADQPLSNSVASAPFDIAAPANVVVDVPVSVSVTVTA